MAGIIDTIYTFRFLKILSTKWENTDAYKLGIIDEDGEPLKKSGDLKSNAEKNAYTPFVRLIFKLKRLMGKIPGGKSAVARYGAAIALIKEHSTEVEAMGINFESLEEGLKRYIGKEKLEEEVTNSVGGVEGKDQPLSDKKPMKRKKKEEEVVDDEESGVKKESKITYQVIDGVVIRIDEALSSSKKRVIKKRIVGGKRQKKREYKSGANSRITRTGNRKLKGGALAKKRRSLRKAKRKAHTGSAAAKRKRSMRKSRRYSK